ncbi:MAG: hypothetical protein P8169_13085, partial [Chloroflexota bacterium]
MVNDIQTRLCDRCRLPAFGSRNNTLRHEHNTVRHFTLNNRQPHKEEVSTLVDISLTLKALHVIVARSV